MATKARQHQPETYLSVGMLSTDGALAADVRQVQDLPQLPSLFTMAIRG